MGIETDSNVSGKYVRRLPDSVPSKTALLIIDMINDYVHPEGAYGRQGVSNPAVNDIIRPINALVNTCKSMRTPVIGTIHSLHRRPDGTPIDMGLLLGIRPFLKKEGLTQGTWGTEFIDQIPECDFYIQKPRLNAFYQTGLEALLRGLGVETILLAGVQTNVCVESTARAAWDMDLNFIIVKDCVTCFDQRLHEASLETLSNLGGVAGSDEIHKALKGNVTDRNKEELK